eukprot:1903391-Pleurochrysis_carterae.AAC.1
MDVCAGQRRACLCSKRCPAQETPRGMSRWHLQACSARGSGVCTRERTPSPTGVALSCVVSYESTT